METAASFTAETMSLQRAFESHRPATSRLFTDPYADAFLRPSLRLLASASGVPLLRRLAVGLFDAVGGPGPRPSAIVRTKVIDDAVTDAAAWAQQCVLLGAGYDTRAHRLPAMAQLHVFEVDHPATQALKQAVIGRSGLADGQITYVPIDFERDDLASKLEAQGFDRAAPTIFVWEGVTNYLTADAVDATLAVIRGLAQASGLLAVTYVDVRALTDPDAFPEARRWARAVARAGEPWIFGLVPDQVEHFFGSRGFQLRYDTSALEAGQLWLTGQRRREHGSALYRIAIADIDTSQ